MGMKKKVTVSEENLRQEKNILLSIIESMSDGVVVCDLKGKFLLFNKASEKFGGKRNYKMTEKEWVGEYGFYQPENGEKIKMAEVPLIRSLNGEILDDIDLIAKSPGGTEDVYIIASSRPVKDGDNKIIGALAVYHDITERIKNEKKIKETTKLLREFANGLQNAREEERAYISREIHDELGQSLTAIKIDLSWLKNKILTADSAAQEKINSILGLIDETVNKVRKISSDLRPGILDELGIIPAIEWQAEEFNKHTGIECEFNCGLNELKISKGKATTIFRIVQESLTNITRHANATKAKIKLEKEGQCIYLSIEDNGRGIFGENFSDLNSLGILGMKERTQKLGGKFAINRLNTEGGTGVYISLPISIEQEKC